MYCPVLIAFATLYPLFFPLTPNFSQNNTRHLYITQKAVCLTDRIAFYKRKKKPKNRKKSRYNLCNFESNFLFKRIEKVYLLSL